MLLQQPETTGGSESKMDEGRKNGRNNFTCKEDGEEDGLVAISLTSEALVRDPTRDVCLGAVPVQRCQTVSQLRNIVCVNISRLPTTFIFLSKQGAPITKSQELGIRVSQIITDAAVVRIQKCYETPRVGVRILGGAAVGFVFIDLSCLVSMLRRALHLQLGHYPDLQEEGHYQFIDRNGWPVSRDQESCLSVMDILDNGSVQLLGTAVLSPSSRARSLRAGGEDHLDSGSPHHHVGGDSSSPAVADSTSIVPVDPLGIKRRRASSLRQPTTWKDKDVARPTDMLEPKQVLISYVRAEAAEHALLLKDALTENGYSVYLDVDEIKSGIDWQDDLNFAVSNCQVFVPLVTLSYGETVWTNREVKLADVLKKFIVPVSFLDHWPPKCLAIQFATTQYIPWKTNDAIRQEEGAGQGERANDTRFWDREHVLRVGSQIGSHVERQRSGPIAQLKQRVSTLKSCPVSLPDDMAQLAAQDRDGAPLVVISVHPEQKDFGATLKSLLEGDGYEVWCSTDLVLHSGPCVNLAGSSCDVTPSPTFSTSSAATMASMAVAGGWEDGLGGGGANDELCSTPLSQEGSCFSSQCSQDNSEMNPADKERQLQFQSKADEAGVVIFVLSKVFAASKTSRQQVFYCEHRKRVIPLRFEEFCMPGWMSMLIGTGVFEDARADGYRESLQARVKRCLDPTARAGSENDVNEAKIKCHVQNLRKKIPRGVSVYISGGTRFYHKDSEKICRAIGEHLARLEDLQIATGGFYGVGDEVGRSYHCERKQSNQKSHIWHVLPERDDQDRSKQARQSRDKTFPMVDYGKTVYSGDSVREREVIVSRVFDICILVEGGPGAAHEAEQFCWNDHVVIPVKVTGGAACGKFNVPEKIFKIPPGVAKEDWQKLSSKGTTPDDIGSAVARIVKCVKDRLQLEWPPAYEFGSSPLPSPLLPLTPGASSSGSTAAVAATSPRRRRPSLTKMKTVRLPSQSSFCFTQRQADIDPGMQTSGPETEPEPESAGFQPMDAQLDRRKRSFNQADL